MRRKRKWLLPKERDGMNLEGSRSNMQSYKNACLVVILLTIGSCCRGAENNPVLSSGGKSAVSAVRLVVARTTVNHDLLEVEYQIQNNSDHDIWICDNS